jgi:hypothetical protein
MENVDTVKTRLRIVVIVTVLLLGGQSWPQQQHLSSLERGRALAMLQVISGDAGDVRSWRMARLWSILA